MRKYILLIIAVISSCNSILAMPCDSAYLCTSAKAKYKIEIQRCRYDNSLKRIINLEISGTSNKNATLSSAWDGDKYLAFEIKLPSNKTTTEELLSIEVLKSNGQGEIIRKSRIENPGPWKVINKEKVRCKISE